MVLANDIFQVEGPVLPPLFEYFAEVKVHGGNYLEKTYMYMYMCTHLPFCKHLESLQCEKICTKLKMEPPFVEASSYASDM